MGKMMKAGTRVEIIIHKMDGGSDYEGGKVARWTKQMGSRDRLPAGYHPVRFDADNAVLMLHETHFRVTDNRAAV